MKGDVGIEKIVLKPSNVHAPENIYHAFKKL